MLSRDSENSPYKKKSPAKWKTIAISLPDISFAHVLCRSLYWYYACGAGLAAEGQANADDTLVVEASTLRFMRHNNLPIRNSRVR